MADSDRHRKLELFECVYMCVLEIPSHDRLDLSHKPQLQQLNQQLVLVSEPNVCLYYVDLSHYDILEFDQFLAQRAAKGDSLPPARPRPQMQKAEDQSDELFAL